MKLKTALVLLAPLVCATSLHAAADYFLEIDGVKGESQDTTHPGSIEILSFSWGMTNTSGGGGAGKVSFQDLHFTTKVNKASPQLMLACATGNHIAKATLFVRKAGSAAQEDYYKITMEDILISSYQSSGRAGDTSGETDPKPTEEVAFYYNKIAFEHTAEDGTVTTGRADRTDTATAQ